MGVSVSGTIDQKTYLKKFRRGSAPLTLPWIRLCVAELIVYTFSMAFI